MIAADTDEKMVQAFATRLSRHGPKEESMQTMLDTPCTRDTKIFRVRRCSREA